MIQSDSICLLAAGQQEHSGTQTFVRDGDETEYLLVMCGIRSVIRVGERQIYMQPFTYVLLPFEDEPELVLETQGLTAYRYMHLRYLDQKPAQTVERETHTIAQPLATEEIWKLVLPAMEADGDAEQELGRRAFALLLCLLREGSDGTVSRAAEVPHYEKLTALRHRIYQHPEESWFIQDICDELGISRPYFHKIYLAAFGTTCTQDVIASRITCAKRLLETTDDPITVVSQRSGFETDVYFMRQFKRHVGMTPTAYRRIYRQSQANEGT